MPEEQCGKARYILNHFLNPVTADEGQENFKERYVRMFLFSTAYICLMHVI